MLSVKYSVLNDKDQEILADIFIDLVYEHKYQLNGSHPSDYKNKLKSLNIQLGEFINFLDRHNTESINHLFDAIGGVEYDFIWDDDMKHVINFAHNMYLLFFADLDIDTDILKKEALKIKDLVVHHLSKMK